MRHLSLSLAAVAAFAVPALAQTVVAPNAYAAAEGGSNNIYPWNRATASMRYQQIYDSTNFTLQGVVSPIIISRVRFRANAAATTTIWAGGTWPNVRIDMSTCPLDFAAASTIFASNHGPDQATVYTGPVSVIGGAGAGTTVPGPWYVDIAVTPFLYNPVSGSDLNFDVFLDGTGWTGASTACDAVSGAATVPGPALGTRVYDTAGITGSVGTVGLHYTLTTEFTYTPAAGLYAAFSATPRSGNSPLMVQFTDQTYTSAPGGVTSWAWDVNGDSVVDYTTQNPMHTYACGTYNVSLTVTDAQNPNSTLTRNGFIVVDAISANFTASTPGGFAPVMVQFTDTSTGPVTAWAWDLNGDTIIDSTLQNPMWVYAVPGNYTVSLTVTNSCRTNTRTRTNFITVLTPGSVPAPPELLQYQFNEVRGTLVGNTASTTAAPATGTVVASTNWWSDPNRPAFRGNEAGFGCLGYRTAAAGSVNTGWTTAVTGSFSVSMWLRKNPAAVATPFGYTFGNGTFRSFVGGAAGTGITFRGSAIGNVDSGFTVDSTPGVWQHVTLVVNDAAGQALWFNNGVPSATVVSFTPNTFAYTSTILFGVGAQNSTGGSPVTLNGYDQDDFRFYLRALLPAEVLIVALTAENASAGRSGSSCNGTLGMPIISGNGLPTLGNSSFAVNLANAESGRLCAVVLGFTPAAFGTFNLAPWLGAGCEMQTDAAAAVFYVTSGAGTASQALAVPANPSYSGLHVYGQWLILGSAGGAVTQLLDVNVR